MGKCRPIVPNQNIYRLKQAEIFQIQTMIKYMKAGFPRLPTNATEASLVRTARKQALMMNVNLIDCRYVSASEIHRMVSKAI